MLKKFPWTDPNVSCSTESKICICSGTSFSVNPLFYNMKTLLLVLVILSIPGMKAKAQETDLPVDIESFYRDKNFVNTYTLREERVSIFTLLTKKEDLSVLEDERLQQSAELLRGLMQKILPVADNMNAGTGYPFQLVLPEINKVMSWHIKDDHIQVSLYTYSLEPEANVYYVASYSPELVPENYKAVDLSELRYTSQEVHDWFYTGNKWQKTTVNKILVK